MYRNAQISYGCYEVILTLRISLTTSGDIIPILLRCEMAKTAIQMKLTAIIFVESTK